MSNDTKIAKAAPLSLRHLYRPKNHAGYRFVPDRRPPHCPKHSILLEGVYCSYCVYLDRREHERDWKSIDEPQSERRIEETARKKRARSLKSHVPYWVGF